MKNPAGGYYAAIDADSEGKEGAFYVWDQSQIKNILGEDAELYPIFMMLLKKGIGNIPISCIFLLL